jgi:hypothetical protein
MTLLVAPVAVAAGLGLLLAAGGAPLWWIGAALLFAGLAVLATHPTVRSFAGLIGEGPLRDTAPIWALVAYTALAFALLPVPAAGDRPIDHDHTVHFFSAWQSATQLWPNGSPWGWSHAWFGGYPAGYHYPIGGELTVQFVRLATFGLLTLSQAYAYTLVGLWVLQGFSVFLLVRTLIPGGRGGFWGPLLAGVLSQLDAGGFRHGGFAFTMTWGVWPNLLGLLYFIVFVSRLSAIVRTGAARQVAVGGLFLGLALVTHPLQMVHAAVVLALAVFAVALAADVPARLVALARLALTYLIGGSIGLFWLAPFLATQEETQAAGKLWMAAQQLGHELADLTALPGMPRAILAVGYLTAVALVVSGRARARFALLLTALVPLTFLFMATTTFITAFRLNELTDGFSTLESERFAVLAKPYVFALTAFGLVALARALRAQAAASPIGQWPADDPVEAHNRYGLRLFAVVFAGTLLAAPTLPSLVADWVRPLVKHRLVAESSRLQKADREALVAWAKTLPPPDPTRGEFDRMALVDKRHDHSMLDISTELPMPLYKVGFTPTMVTKARPEAGDLAHIEALNVRYVLLDSIPAGSTFSGPLFREVRRFGTLTVIEYLGWKGALVQPVHADGRPLFPIAVSATAQALNPRDEPLPNAKAATATAQVVPGLAALPRPTGPQPTVTLFDRERIEFDVPEGVPGAALRVGVTTFSRWQARLDGEAVAIRPLQIDRDPRTAFISLPNRSGHWVLTFERGGAEKLAWLGLAFGLGLALWLTVAPPRGLAGRVAHALTTFEGRLLGPLYAVGTVALVGLVALPVVLVAVAPHGEQGSVYDFVAKLHTAKVNNPERCVHLLDAHLCGADNSRDVFATAAMEHDGVAAKGPVYRCILLRGSQATLRYKGVPSFRGLAGDALTLKGTTSRPTLKVTVNGGPETVVPLSARKGHTDIDARISATGDNNEVTLTATGLEGTDGVCLQLDAVE